MDFSQYPENIQNLKQKVMEARSQDQNLLIEYCGRLIEIGASENDAYILGFSYYYTAEGYMICSNYAEFLKNLLTGIEYQQKASQWRLLARSYNLLGIDTFTQGNVTVALDHYLESLKYCEKYKFQYEKAMVYTNIGHIHHSQKDNASALTYLWMGRELFEQEIENPFAAGNLILIDIERGQCLLSLGEKAQALDCEKLINERIDSFEEDDSILIPALCFLAQVRHMEGDISSRDKLIGQVICKIGEDTPVLNVYEDIFRLCEFLLETDKIQELLQVCGKIEKLIENLGITKLKLELQRIWIKYYQKIGNRQGFLEACADMYEIGDAYQEENNKITRTATKLRFKVEELKKKEEDFRQERLALIEKSERDALTNLPNRYKLNDYSEIIFEKVYRKKKSLGVAMLDIDYFKQYNDTYGHQAGDDCIQKVAAYLAQVGETHDLFCARYGGDEFIMIYYDKTDQEILQVAQEIRQGIQNLGIVHRKSQVAQTITISQGIRNTIPMKGNKIWDYLFAADTALYKAKKQGRNGIYLVHKMTAEGVNTITM